MAIEIERLEGVARIRLASPQTRNALSLPLARALAEALEQAAADPEIRCLLLEAEGEAFCVGADLKAAAPDPPTTLAALARLYHRSTRALLTAPKPAIAAIGGVAAGGGLALALACDLRLASPRARFRLAWSGIGLSPDGGATWLLPRLIGLARAQELLLLDPVLEPARALSLGLIHRLIPPEALPGEAMAQALALAEGPTLAYAETRRLLHPPALIEATLEREAAALARTAASLDGQEGLRAFLDKRPPRFRGR